MTTDDMTDDLDTELRSDAILWREQVDGLRPNSAPAPTLQRRRMTPVLAGLAAAAVVLGATVLVLMLRHNAGSTPRIQAGIATGPAPSAVSTHVPNQAQCTYTKPGANHGTGFEAARPPGVTGTRTLAEAVRAAKYGPRDIGAWHIAARNARAVLLLSGPRYLHIERLRDGSWFVDSGGSCINGTATLH